jgi:hypothetical protein
VNAYAFLMLAVLFGLFTLLCVAINPKPFDRFIDNAIRYYNLSLGWALIVGLMILAAVLEAFTDREEPSEDERVDFQMRRGLKELKRQGKL